MFWFWRVQLQYENTQKRTLRNFVFSYNGKGFVGGMYCEDRHHLPSLSSRGTD